MEFVTVEGDRLEYRLLPGSAANRPPLVFLHEGLGSIALWKDFPDKVAEATGCAVLVYSRAGYGGSAPLKGPRNVDYMHVEAKAVLPRLLDRLDIAAPLLIGHSDGASIALIHAGATPRRVTGLVLMAPHVFVEDLTIAGIADAKTVFGTSDLGRRLGRYHDDATATFWGWNDIWLNPDFRAWNIEALLPAVTAPALLIQGEGDEYGTLAQLDAIERQVSGPTTRLVLPDCRHSPHRDQETAVLDAITRFVARLGLVHDR